MPLARYAPTPTDEILVATLGTGGRIATLHHIARESGARWSAAPLRSKPPTSRRTSRPATDSSRPQRVGDRRRRRHLSAVRPALRRADAAEGLLWADIDPTAVTPPAQLDAAGH